MLNLPTQESIMRSDAPSSVCRGRTEHFAGVASRASPWRQAAREGLATGAIAGVMSAVAASAFGRRDSGSAVAPINAVSHWLWGDRAGEVRQADLPHTAVGAVTNVLAAMFWATLHARVRPRAAAAPVGAAIAGGIATSAVAAGVDYGLVPRRFTPGWELSVSNRSMAGIFAVLAAGIAIGTVIADRRA
jgi:hypothetical protein